MEIWPTSAKLGLWRPWRHCGAAVPPAILILGHRIHATVNGPADDVVPVGADVTLDSVKVLGLLRTRSVGALLAPISPLLGVAIPFLAPTPCFQL